MRLRLSRGKVNFKLSLDEFERLFAEGELNEQMALVDGMVLCILIQLSDNSDQDIHLTCLNHEWQLQISKAAASGLLDKLPSKAGLATRQQASTNHSLDISVDIDIRTQIGLNKPNRKHQSATR